MSIRRTLNKEIYRSSRQHYLKWDLPIEHTSIRFCFVTNGRNIDQCRKFLLKDHLTKEVTILTKQEALLYLKIPGVFNTQKEIVGHFVPTKKAYVKYEITDNSIVEIQEVVKDEIFSRTELRPSLLTRLVDHLIKGLL